jgi:hypothetical protein
MGQVANPNRLKKKKLRNEKDNHVHENSLKFGRIKEQHNLKKNEYYSEELRLDGHKRDL